MAVPSTRPWNRPAQRCTAHRTDGQPCRAYSIHGGRVCAAHGGRAPRVKDAAQRRWMDAMLGREFERAMGRHEKRVAAWQQQRVEATAELMGVAPEQVSPALIGVCSVLCDRPDLVEAPAARLELDGRSVPRLRAAAR